jgi:hypothetical protein
MSNLIITENTWSTLKKSLLLTRSEFDFDIFGLFFSNESPVFENTRIRFPNCLTKQERWRIHTYSEKNMVISHSEDTPEGDRILTLDLSKEYMKTIYGIYQCTLSEPEEPEEPIVNLPMEAFEKFKRAILDDIMTLVDKHLNKEFLKFYI